MKAKLIISSVLSVLILLILIFISGYFIIYKPITNITYSVENNLNDNRYVRKGAYYEADNTYIIAMGEKNTGGYSIEIDKVNIDSKGNVEVVVKETSPKLLEEESATMAFTHPICKITLNKSPRTINFKNEYGDMFKKINF